MIHKTQHKMSYILILSISAIMLLGCNQKQIEDFFSRVVINSVSESQIEQFSKKHYKPVQPRGDRDIRTLNMKVDIMRGSSTVNGYSSDGSIDFLVLEEHVIPTSPTTTKTENMMCLFKVALEPKQITTSGMFDIHVEKKPVKEVNGYVFFGGDKYKYRPLDCDMSQTRFNTIKFNIMDQLIKEQRNILKTMAYNFFKASDIQYPYAVFYGDEELLLFAEKK